MKSVHLDKKLSATAHLPKQSTIIESPSGKIAKRADVFTSPGLGSGSTQSQAQTQQVDFSVASQGQRPTIQQSVPGPSTGPVRHPRPPQGLWQQQQQALPARPPRPALILPPPPPPADSRPGYLCKNTEVKIVDKPTPPTPPATTPPEGDPGSVPTLEGLTLADIPRLTEAAQAMGQRRLLPRHGLAPYVAELTPLELAIVRHAAVVVLYRSPLRDQVDLDEISEMVEVKKQGFWGKLFKGNDKNIKKKGASPYSSVGYVGLMVGWMVRRSLWGTIGATCRARGGRHMAWRIEGHAQSAELHR